MVGLWGIGKLRTLRRTAALAGSGVKKSISGLVFLRRALGLSITTLASGSHPRQELVMCRLASLQG